MNQHKHAHHTVPRKKNLWSLPKSTCLFTPMYFYNRLTNIVVRMQAIPFQPSSRPGYETRVNRTQTVPKVCQCGFVAVVGMGL
jgi:hypothetical protein